MYSLSCTCFNECLDHGTPWPTISNNDLASLPISLLLQVGIILYDKFYPVEMELETLVPEKNILGMASRLTRLLIFQSWIVSQAERAIGT